MCCFNISHLGEGGTDIQFFFSQSNLHPYPGKVVHVDLKRRAAHLHFNNLRRPVPVGTELRVQVIGPDNQSRAGRLRVYESFPDSVNVTAIDQPSVAVLEVGAVIERVSAWQTSAPQPPEAQVRHQPASPRRAAVMPSVMSCTIQERI